MGVYLDSASGDDAVEAARLGFIRGITTNPVLLAATGLPPERVIAALCDALPGATIFYQLTHPAGQAGAQEARLVAGPRPDRVGLKIPCAHQSLQLARDLAADGYVVGMTAIFSAAQAYMAAEAGVRYVLPYVNRSTRLLGDGVGLVERMRAVIDAAGSGLEIIAASIKSPEEAVATILAGAHHVTLPLEVLRAMSSHPLSDAAAEEFAAVRWGQET